MPPKKTKQSTRDKLVAKDLPSAPSSKKQLTSRMVGEKARKASATTTAPQLPSTKSAPKTNGVLASKKRKAEEAEEKEEPQVNGTNAKRAKTESSPSSSKKATSRVTTAQRAPSAKPAENTTTAVKKEKAAAKPKPSKKKVLLNQRQTEVLDMYLFGGGEAGELGFAGVKGSVEIKRPRLNPYLTADKAGVVQFAVGGMHTAALTHDNKILTWGVNDQGALGRDTTWEGGLTDMKEAGDGSDSDSDSDDGEINPHESTPKEVDFSGLESMPSFTQVVASDSATFALTDDGLVYGWGTFRSNEGIFGFSQQTLIQDRPALIPNLKNITKLATGTNHVLALDASGTVYAWGAGQQNQLGRRILERHLMSSLTPTKLGIRGKCKDIGAGSFHSFAVKSTGDVYSWGLNSFGQTGLEINTSEGGPDVHLPAKVTSLSPSAGNGTVTQITGGSHHSIAITDTGVALAWGRLDGYQVGIPISSLPDVHLVRDANKRPRILTQPTPIPDLNVTAAAAGSDHSIVVTKEGKAYSFGFNEYGQCGVGTTEDVQSAELIDNTAVRGKQLVAVGCGGQFSCLASVHEESAATNGAVNGN